ncbi:SDR family NAD(P)-dependent oxidoreductase [Catenulispora yoronensis]|uniref:SDR family NAD(P)-dependent oxidoreductase n=1 Tax=Catenulispora yoronensis TaxID=450799 RepID=A0ABN2TVX7_9ACTN
MTLITTPFDSRTTAAEVLAGLDLAGRRMVVTGGASGLGTETVRALAGAGAQVVVATRDPALAKPLLDEFPAVTAAELDLADLRSVRAFVRDWRGPLHSLVANAGVMMLPERRLSAQGWEMQLAVNYLGHFALIHGLHDALRAAGTARVVTVSSGAQRLQPVDFADPQFERRPYDPMVAYAQSKTADALLAVGVSRRWAEDGVTANSCEPGWIHTNLQRHLDPATMRAFGAMDEDGNLLTPDYYKTPAQGASTSVLLAASPLLEGVTGRYFEDNRESAPIDGGPEFTMTGVARWATDPVAADELWDYALPFLGS